MTYAQYLQQFVNKTGALTRITGGGAYQFSLSNDGYDRIKLVGTDFIQIAQSSVFASDSDTIIPLNLFVLKTA